MSAGMIGVPAIVPLKIPGFGATASRKWSVDTKTPIEMHSTTKNCLLFYTLDGTKPDPFKKIGDKTTYQYTKPITLPCGKRTLKAIAVFKDGSRESNVNTKIFQVSQAAIEDRDEEDGKFNTTWQCHESDDDHDEQIDARMFKKVMKNSQQSPSPEKKDPVRKIMTGDVEDEENFELNGGIKEEEYLMCVYCEEPRPADPYARFCNGCKAILPPAPGRIRSSYGGTFQNLIKSNQKLKIECKICGTSNSSSAQECIVCDSSLNGLSKSQLKSEKALEPASNFIICPYCTRVNCGNARYCDWCGERSNSKSRTVICLRCSTENLVSSQYCCSCGKNLPAPQRESLEKILEQGNVQVKNLTTSSKGQLTLLEKLTNGDQSEWKSVELESIKRKESKNIAVQAGDSMVSSLNKLSLKGPSKNSPGKGFWRQQADFVSQHFKTYTQNNIEFREKFSNESLSSLISARLEDDEDKKMKNLVLLFSVPDVSSESTKKKKKQLTINSGETLMNALKKSGGSRPSSGRNQPSSIRSRPSSARSYTIQNSPRDSQNGSRPSSGCKTKTKKTMEKEKLDTFYGKLSLDTKDLLDVIKSDKAADVETVESLLDSDDVDIKACDENGIPLLKLAVLKKHFDILLSLILGGVDVDAISGSKKNTALHEAVLLGVVGKDAVEILLENNASFTITDKKGLSAYDLAVVNNVDAILAVFNQHTSKGLLKDVMKL